MTKLLNENFHRYMKSGSTWWGMFAMVCLTALALMMINAGAEFADTWILNPMSLQFCFFVITAVVGIIISRDYKHRTINNKLSSGHTRMQIYLSKLLTSVIAGLIVFAVYIAVCLAVGVPMLGLHISSAAAATVSFLFLLLIIAAKVSLIVMITMSIKGGLRIGAAFGLQYIFTMVSGFISEDPDTKLNKFLIEALPSCQSMLLSFSEISGRIGIMAVYSLIFIALTTAAGIAIFNKTDLK